MGKIIAVVNQKGGVGKTTTTINLSACIAEKGKSVLTIDMDPQGNTSSGLNIDKNNIEKSVYELLIGETVLESVKIKTEVQNLEVVPANINLAGAEIELINYKNREYILKKILDHTKYLYDYIIIDCPPSLNILTINALCAADTLLVPLQCEYFALEGLSQLMHTVDLVKKSLNPDVHIEGIVFTMFDARTNLSLQVVEEVKKYISSDIYTCIIPRNVRLSEAPSYGKPITMYDPRSKGSESYRLLADLVVGGE